MQYLSICSGIEAASVAWESLGWTVVAFSEIEKFPSAVLNYRFPHVPNLGDMTKYKEWDIGAIDVLVGGTPCQSFSVAGLRKGMDDPRGNLAIVYCGILERFKPKWFVWENVPGVLSSGSGRDFGSFLGAVVKLGYGFAYRVLDAQFCGVPQRRRRVFVVGHLGDWRRAAAVLFESESMCRNTAKGRSKKQEVARSLRGRANSSHREDADSFVVTHALRGEGFDASEDGTGRGTSLVPVISHACLAKGGSGRLDPSCETFIACTLPATDGGVSSGMHPVIAIQERAVAESVTTGPQGTGIRGDGKAFTLEARRQPQAVAFDTTQIPGALRCHDGGHSAIAYQCQGSNVGPMGTLRSGNGNETGGVPFIPLAIGSRARGDDGRGYERPEHFSEVAGTVDATKPERVLTPSMAVRRLTPRECERLQGFPDDWTLIDYRGKPAKDGPRYKAIGNSMAVPVMRWIGERIQLVEFEIN